MLFSVSQKELQVSRGDWKREVSRSVKNNGKMLGSSRHLKSQTRKFFTIFPCSRKLLKCHLGKNEATKSTAKQVLEKIKQTFPVLHLVVKSLAVFFYSCLTVTSKRFLRGSNFVTAKHGRDCVQQSSIFLVVYFKRSEREETRNSIE